MTGPDVNLWTSAAHVSEYLERADTIPHRVEGEATLLECLPTRVERVLDLGSGDGRLLATVRRARPDVHAIATDFSPAMLQRLEQRFARDPRVVVTPHDLSTALPEAWGSFDVIVSSFAIHHLPHARKRSLYTEIFNHLAPGGLFANLEHVASPTLALHHQFLAALGVRPENEDPSNKLLDLNIQLRWLRAIGFVDVDCLWKWR